jgi:hypothetical protein
MDVLGKVNVPPRFDWLDMSLLMGLAEFERDRYLQRSDEGNLRNDYQFVPVNGMLLQEKAAS